MRIIKTSIILCLIFIAIGTYHIKTIENSPHTNEQDGNTYHILANAIPAQDGDVELECAGHLPDIHHIHQERTTWKDALAYLGVVGIITTLFTAAIQVPLQLAHQRSTLLENNRPFRLVTWVTPNNKTFFIDYAQLWCCNVHDKSYCTPCDRVLLWDNTWSTTETLQRFLDEPKNLGWWHTVQGLCIDPPSKTFNEQEERFELSCIWKK